MQGERKPVHWVGTSIKVVRGFPERVKQEVGFSIYLAQMDGKAINAVPLVGFGGAKVLEVVVDDDGNTYRIVYTVRFAEAVYVLHAFRKKSKRGIATPKSDIRLIQSRLKVAEQDYADRYGARQRKEQADERGA